MARWSRISFADANQDVGKGGFSLRGCSLHEGFGGFRGFGGSGERLALLLLVLLLPGQRGHRDGFDGFGGFGLNSTPLSDILSKHAIPSKDSVWTSRCSPEYKHNLVVKDACSARRPKTQKQAQVPLAKKKLLKSDSGRLAPKKQSTSSGSEAAQR